MKIICVGRNYGEHAKELNNAVPEEPVLFMKAQNALLLPGKPFYYPEFTQDLHYECELVLKICKGGKHIAEKFAHKYYTEVSLGIDFTARDVQDRQKKKGLPWEIAKSFDNSAAIGRFVPLGDMDPQALTFELKRNEEVVQVGNTADMIFSIPKILAYASQFFTLNTGDLIYTGTPAGVGPVAINDKLTGSLNGEVLLDVSIR